MVTLNYLLFSQNIYCSMYETHMMGSFISDRKHLFILVISELSFLLHTWHRYNSCDNHFPQHIISIIWNLVINISCVSSPHVYIRPWFLLTHQLLSKQAWYLHVLSEYIYTNSYEKRLTALQWQSSLIFLARN
jgi:hypothetical protein